MVQCIIDTYLRIRDASHVKPSRSPTCYLAWGQREPGRKVICPGSLSWESDGVWIPPVVREPWEHLPQSPRHDGNPSPAVQFLLPHCSHACTTDILVGTSFYIHLKSAPPSAANHWFSICCLNQNRTSTFFLPCDGSSKILRLLEYSSKSLVIQINYISLVFPQTFQILLLSFFFWRVWSHLALLWKHRIWRLGS